MKVHCKRLLHASLSSLGSANTMSNSWGRLDVVKAGIPCNKGEETKEKHGGRQYPRPFGCGEEWPGEFPMLHEVFPNGKHNPCPLKPKSPPILLLFGTTVVYND